MNYLVMGICLGEQMINVACSGTLYQDIPKEVYNKNNVEDILADTNLTQHRNYYKEIYNQPGIVGFALHKVRLTNEFGTHFLMQNMMIISRWSFLHIISAYISSGSNLGVHWLTVLTAK